MNEAFGAACSLFSLLFIGGFAAVLGAFAGMKVAAWALGPISINVALGRVYVQLGEESQK